MSETFRAMSNSVASISLLFISFVWLGTTAAQTEKATSSSNLAAAKRKSSDVFQPTWDSLRANYKTPEWFNKAKFGIFIHWGLYAVPAYHNEWYAKHMYGQFAEWHTAHFGAPDKFGYKDFIPLFRAEKYDPDAWANLFKKAGARYVVAVAEHHDGFAMYDSALTKWNAKQMGPKRDLIGDLATAVRKRGLIFGLSSHRMEHHTFMYPTTKMKTDLFDPAYADFYGPPQPGEMNDGNASKEFQMDWLARCEELVDKYRPQLFYFDNGVNHRNYDDVKLQFAAYYYNRALEWKKQVSITAKDLAYLAGSIADYEKIKRAPNAILPGAWQVDEPIAGNSWGYVREMQYRSASSIIGELIEVASRGGNLLLNISPRADGTIPDEQQKILLEIGNWLDLNGAAIYGSRAWIKAGEGGPGEPQFRFTTNKHALYVFVLNFKDAQAVVKSLAKSDTLKIKKVELLGYRGKLNFTQNESGLQVALPVTAKTTSWPLVLKISGQKFN